MTVSSVNHLPATPIVDDKSNGNPANPNEPHRSAHPAPSPPPTGTAKAAPASPPESRGARGNLLARSGKGNEAAGARKTSSVRSKQSADKAWNTGLAIACELVHALVPEQHGTDGSASRPLHEFEEMIGAMSSGVQKPAIAGLLAKATDRVRSSVAHGGKNGDAAAAAEPNADLLKKMEGLQSDKDDLNAMGFYTVMAVMSAAVGFAESINMVRTGGADTVGEKLVLEFANEIGKLLQDPSTEPTDSPQPTLIAMAKTAATDISLQFLPGKGITASLLSSMSEWGKKVSGAEERESLRQLKNALGRFLDARIGHPE